MLKNTERTLVRRKEDERRYFRKVAIGVAFKFLRVVGYHFDTVIFIRWFKAVNWTYSITRRSSLARIRECQVRF